MTHNPDCDGEHCTADTGEVRRLPTSGDAAIILCWSCWAREIQWRRAWNRQLCTHHDGRFAWDLPAWESLEVYS
jgi:hypothetical protein